VTLSSISARDTELKAFAGVDSQRNLVRIMPKQLQVLEESMHKNVRPGRGNFGDLIWQQVVCCERQRLV
jgi:hypothetical protein